MTSRLPTIDTALYVALVIVGIAVGGMAPNLFGSTMFVGLLGMIAWILVSDRHRR